MHEVVGRCNLLQAAFGYAVLQKVHTDRTESSRGCLVHGTTILQTNKATVSGIFKNTHKNKLHTQNNT